MDTKIGKVVDKRYRFIKLINSTILGETYLAEDTHRPGSPQCLVKEIKLGSFNQENREVILLLFQEKVEKIDTLSKHEGLPNLLAYFEENDNIYLVEDYIVGNSLAEDLGKDEPFLEGEVINILREALEVLAWIHGQGEVHGKIKPGNLVRRILDGKLCLINFGLEREIQKTLELNKEPSILEKRSQNNSDSSIYVPLNENEQIVEQKNDIYALGIIAIQALTGLLPKDLLKQRQTKDTSGIEIPWQNLQACSLALSDIIDKIVNGQGKESYESATEVLADLSKISVSATSELPPKPETKKLNFLSPLFQFVKQNKVILTASLTLLTIAGGAIAYFGKYQFIVKAQALYNEGQELAKQQKQLAAIASYTEALKLNPRNALILYQRGNSYYIEKDYEKAIEDYIAAIEIKSNYNHAYYQLALAYYEQKNNEKAITNLTQALRTNPNYTKAYDQRGKIYYEIGDYKNAIQDYSQLIGFDPEDSNSYINRGIARAKIGDQSGAVSDYTQAINLNANKIQAYHNRGNSYFEIGNYQNALADYNQVLKLKPDDSDAYASRCSVYLNLVNYQAAITECNRAIEIDPQNDLAYNHRCIAYFKLREYQRAIEDCSIAIDINNKNAKAYVNRGLVQFANGYLDEAIADFTQAIKINPEDSLAYNHRGILFSKIGNYNQAIEDFSQVIKLNPDNTKAYDNREVIRYKKQGRSLAIGELPKNTNLSLEPNKIKDYQNSLKIVEKLH
ncbi:tetratricopeptide repeat protein [Okeania sp.]|uniref:tetratricopeptide repeat protein n=1 Tax=Okeania sp. TaxID=3100323 RepID=UPI002B4B29FF|nr:tetratricopeptide repeat protein [Okeania sp.]MEB3339195.1 tetratricopeptide repeat protein [Okeania sp.]